MNNQKARGVLGSELWRRVEACLLIEKTSDQDIRRITTDYSLGKNRNGSDKVEAFFKWDNNPGMHISCGGPADQTPGTGKTASERTAITQELDGKTWAYSDIKNMIIEKFSRSERTAKNRIAELLTAKLINRNSDGIYSVTKPELPDWIQN